MIKEKESHLSITHWNKGIYFMKITDDISLETFKITKQ